MKGTHQKDLASREKSGGVVVYALSMAFGTMTSRLLGLVRDLLFAAFFTRTITDAWTAAFRLPNMFRRLLGEGSLSVSFIPVFVESQVQDSSLVRSRNLVNSFYTLLLIVLSVLTAVGVLWPDHLLAFVLDKNFSDIPGKFELTVRMARIMFVFIFFMSTYAYFMGIMNAMGKFALPAMAPTLFNIAMIAANFVPQAWLASPGDALAWGVVVGGFLQTAILVPSLMRMGYLPKISTEFFNRDSLKVLRNMLPGMLGTGLLQITTVVNLRFASSLGEGPVSYIYLADRLLELPLSLVAVSLGTALLPTLSDMWARSEKEKMASTANYYLRLNLFIAIPAAIGLFFLARPVVEVLFLRGRFMDADAMITAGVVQVYSFILISASVVRVLVPSFYAIKNTWFPALVSGVSLLVHIIIAPLLMKGWGLHGLNASSFFSATLNWILLLLFYRLWIGPFHLGRLLKSVVQFSFAGVALAITLQLYEPLRLSLFDPDLFWSKFIALIVTIGLGALAYFVVAFLLRTEELQVTLRTVSQRIRKRLGR